MPITIVTTSPTFGTVGGVPDFIAEHGWRLIRCTDASQPDGGVGAHAAAMDFLVVGLAPAAAATIAAAPRLRAVLKHGVGVDNIDIAAASARGIPVLNAPGSNANAVAELALGGMLSLARRIPMLHRVVVDGGWERFVGGEIEGKTLGVVGLGTIGRILARKAIGLGLRVIASDPYPDREFCVQHGIELVDLEPLLRRADYVSLHVFGGKENTHLIGAAELALMRPTAFLLNFARGEVVDTDALAAALEGGVIAGAAIDAYTVEPPDRSHPLFACPKVVFTPHSGADTRESVERMGMMVVTDIAALLAGEQPPRILNPAALGDTGAGSDPLEAKGIS
ncbi:MAG: phosphoglycerate dehydrogenase [Planctomycetes bacterium]|nr:phosphoglycerate dehydrogenase [Planctomycetota bacterium]